MPHLSVKSKNIFMAAIKYILEKYNGFPIKKELLRQHWQYGDDDNKVLFLLEINGSTTPKSYHINFILLH